MNTIERKCIRDYVLDTPDGDTFTIHSGETYTTTEVGFAMAAHGPEPMEGRVVVFTKYWCSVPMENFAK